jgi:hypothetical protein
LSASGGLGLSGGLQADFSGLRTSVSAGAGGALPDARTVLALTSAPRAEGTAFGVGGRLQGGASASLAVDVSGDGGLNTRLKFGP